MNMNPDEFFANESIVNYLEERGLNLFKYPRQFIRELMLLDVIWRNKDKDMNWIVNYLMTNEFTYKLYRLDFFADPEKSKQLNEKKVAADNIPDDLKEFLVIVAMNKFIPGWDKIEDLIILSPQESKINKWVNDLLEDIRTGKKKIPDGYWTSKADIFGLAARARVALDLDSKGRVNIDKFFKNTLHLTFPDPDFHMVQIRDEQGNKMPFSTFFTPEKDKKYYFEFTDYGYASYQRLKKLYERFIQKLLLYPDFEQLCKIASSLAWRNDMIENISRFSQETIAYNVIMRIYGMMIMQGLTDRDGSFNKDTMRGSVKVFGTYRTKHIPPPDRFATKFVDAEGEVESIQVATLLPSDDNNAAVGEKMYVFNPFGRLLLSRILARIHTHGNIYEAYKNSMGLK